MRDFQDGTKCRCVFLLYYLPKRFKNSVFLAYIESASHTTMSLTADKQIRLQFGLTIDAIAAELSPYLPIREVSLIVEDFALTIPAEMWVQGICVRCNAKHRCKKSNLCQRCQDVCLSCRELNMGKSNICSSCIVKLENNFMFSLKRPKHELWGEWYGGIQPPSYMHRKFEAAKKQRADEEQKLRDFHAAELQKPTWMLVSELRVKLQTANIIINQYREAHPDCGLPAQPQYPYY